jgi:hypothetical protein
MINPRNIFDSFVKQVIGEQLTQWLANNRYFKKFVHKTSDVSAKAVHNAVNFPTHKIGDTFKIIKHEVKEEFKEFHPKRWFK